MAYDLTNPDSINPGKWQRRKAFYFDGNIALMMGHYDEDPEECIGMRWMAAEGPLGYPVTRGYPQWMVMPARLARYMLEGIERNWDQEVAHGHVVDQPEYGRAMALLRSHF